MSDELKTLVDDLHSAWEGELKPRIEQMQAEQATQGEAHAETKQAIDKVQDRLDQVEVQMQQAMERAQRPAAGEPSEAMKAFVEWARKGEKMSPEQKAILVSDEEQEGVLAPEEFVTELIKGVVQYSPIRDIARVRTTSRSSVKAPKRTGVASASWVGEQGTRTDTSSRTLGLEEIPTHELYARVEVSNWDLEDSIVNAEADLRADMAEQFGVAEGLAFVSGNGVKKPEGFTVATDVGILNNNSGAIVGDDLVKLPFELKEEYWPNARYVLNRISLRDTRLLKDAVNGQYLWFPGVLGGAQLASGLPPTINGYPYTIAKDMANPGADTLPVAFGDFQKGYWVVDRIQIAVLRDPYSAAGDGNVIFHARKRVGGQVVLSEAITLLQT